MQRLPIVLLMSATLAATSGCATKKFVRSTVQDSSDKLSARIETNESDTKELRDSVNQKVAGVDERVTGVDSKVSALDARTNEGFTSVRNDVKGVDQRASEARNAADRAGTAVSALDEKFANRNMYGISAEQSVQFKFDSAKLDKQYMEMLDGVASTLATNPNAIVVLEGRTDATGNKDYNVKLGERRVEAVRRYLAVEKGVPVYRIHEISFGSDKPIAENNTRDGREKNRTVVMTVLVPKTDGDVASRNEE